MSHQTNITRIRAVNNTLGNLKDRVVFVGGATVSLYTDRAAPESRPTDDVDILVEIATYREYANLKNNYGAWVSKMIQAPSFWVAICFRASSLMSCQRIKGF